MNSLQLQKCINLKKEGIAYYQMEKKKHYYKTSFPSATIIVLMLVFALKVS